ncbi:PAS domain S-box protein [Natrarchaeobaculum aegyptiacum]|uniref:histidine kinase n=1 Tax=Natrarchaeobaculum aegyptiacum TaxID=745377 RepID=A0A2Z2HSK9_9EURY|nr:PAS domain S-box protein [Natrarchaeobaculum aegyptiacum]ARS88377.1 hypothetical protein B1756_00460 [Natrarchaeobaculum aegyptiacum]
MAPPAPANRTAATDVFDGDSPQQVVAELGDRSFEGAPLESLCDDAAEAVVATLGTSSCVITCFEPGGSGRVLAVAGAGAGERNRTRTEPDATLDGGGGIAVPLGSVGNALGALETYGRSGRRFDRDERTFLRNVATVVAGAVERDRSSRARTVEQRRRDEILDASPIGITLVDADGALKYANERAQTLLGESLEELRTYVHGDERWDLVDESGDSLSTDDLPFTTVEETGKPVYDDVLGLERPDGTRVWLSMHCRPLFDDEGELDGAVYALQDVTDHKHLEIELEETLDRVTDAFHALDTDWRFTYVNQRAAELLGVDREDVHGESVWEAFPSAVDSRFEREYRRAMETQESVTFEEYSPVAEAWLEVSVYPSETGLSVYFRDVTERKERDRTLGRYETIVETVEDGIYTVDDDGYFRMVNEAYVELTGFSREELVGRHASEIVDDDVVERARSLAEEGGGKLEAEVETADGESLVVEATVTKHVDDVSGEKRRIGVVRDVTERKRRQRKLEESEQRYRTLVDHFPNGVVALFDEELEYTLAGGQYIDDCTIAPGESAGGATVERVANGQVANPTVEVGDDVENERRTLESIFEAVLDGESHSFELTHDDRDLLVHTIPVRNADGEVFAGMLMAQDVTDRREYEQRLEESNERLEQFAHAASHDLQEPLRMISSYLTLLEQRYEDDLDEEGREFLAYAVDGADRMRAMIDGLLEFSRVESRGAPFEPVDLDEVLADVRRDLEVCIEERDADVVVEPLPTVLGDGNQLRQVFQNLLANGIEYAGADPPQIEVTADRKGRQWELAVEDDGIGIDPGDAEQIFGLFERLHGVEEHPGSGIGLALCERIVERHGGEIRVESEPGEGSTFYLTLPAVDAEEE